MDLGIYYTHFLDTASHWNWDFHTRDRFLLSDLPKDLGDDAWEDLVQRNRDDPAFHAYRLVDESLGAFVASHPDAVFLVCSDHGWTYSGYEHFGSPDGVLILSGPGVREGTVLSGCKVEDVAPTVLGLLEVPLAETLPGRFLAEAFREPPVLLSSEAYGMPAYEGTVQETVDPEELERLQALGYLN